MLFELESNIFISFTEFLNGLSHSRLFPQHVARHEPRSHDILLAPILLGTMSFDVIFLTQFVAMHCVIRVPSLTKENGSSARGCLILFSRLTRLGDHYFHFYCAAEELESRTEGTINV